MLTGPITVLVVDDSEPFRLRLNCLLKELANLHPVVHAGSYDEAIQRLEKGNIDLVLLDIGLPGKSGIRLLRSISKRWPEVKVIVVTNHANEHYRNISLSYGAVCFLDKSHEFERVVREIARLTGNKQPP